MSRRNAYGNTFVESNAVRWREGTILRGTVKCATGVQRNIIVEQEDWKAQVFGDLNNGGIKRWRKQWHKIEMD